MNIPDIVKRLEDVVKQAEAMNGAAEDIGSRIAGDPNKSAIATDIATMGHSAEQIASDLKAIVGDLLPHR